MMRLMIEKARLEEPISGTGGSSGSGGDLHKVRRWNRQRSKSPEEDSGGEALCVDSSSEEDRVTQRRQKVKIETPSSGSKERPRSPQKVKKEEPLEEEKEPQESSPEKDRLDQYTVKQEDQPMREEQISVELRKKKKK